MFFARFVLLIPLLLLICGSVHGEKEDPKAAEHTAMLEKLYPTPAFKVIVQTDVPHDVYQQAINDAYRAGVPRSILNECVASRAMMKADAAALQQLLPALKMGVENYRPETSLFPDKAAAGFIVKVVEAALNEEQRTPGTLAVRAKRALEMGIARKVRQQLATVDSLVDQQAIEKNLGAGAVIPEAQWRSGANPSSRIATTGTDELGNSFGPQVVDKPPTVPKASYERLKTVVPDTFWAPFGVPK